jgi:hypothetical protein
MDLLVIKFNYDQEIAKVCRCIAGIPTALRVPVVLRHAVPRTPLY